MERTRIALRECFRRDWKANSLERDGDAVTAEWTTSWTRSFLLCHLAFLGLGLGI